jgi:carbon starvation protein CstA
MVSFIIGLVCLLVGYLLYGKLAEKVFHTQSEAKTPAVRINDGVDFVPMSTWRCILVEFLNIAGTGPIFGAITGAYFGPAAYGWIVFGCIFAGAVHDFLVGMMSTRNDGATIDTLTGRYLGRAPLYIMRVFTVVLLLFVGVVFVTTPAQVIQTLAERVGNTNGKMVFTIALVIIFVYYIAATLFPINVLIGNIYPIFGAALIIMGAGLFVMMFVTGEARQIPELWNNLHGMNPGVYKAGIDGAAATWTPTIMTKHVFPFLFITIACGAVSGFHATQAPLMSRCIKNESEGRKVFYGAMILEGVIAMIWASVAMSHFHGVVDANGIVDPIKSLTAAGSAAKVVTNSSVDLMGVFGGILAVLGVVACPITSGDTAFRSCRLTLAGALGYDQKPIKNRLLVAIPMFAVGVLLVLFMNASTANFNIIWRYFSFSNQALATIALWVAAAYLAKTAKKWIIALVPAAFMTVVVTSYFLTANECVGPLITAATGNPDTTYMIGICTGIVLMVVLVAMFIPMVAIRERGTIREVLNADGKLLEEDVARA